jgi:hypothetical protein
MKKIKNAQTNEGETWRMVLAGMDKLKRIK